MTYLLFIGLLIALINIHNRVRKLEKRSTQEVRPLIAQKPVVGQGAAPSGAPVSAELTAYIKSQLMEGVRLPEIRSALIARGWEGTAVDQALAIVPAVAIERETSRGSGGGAFIRWIKEDWLMKLGALLLLIGFGWLVSYAFLHNWIGPMGRIMLGLIAGALFIVLGWWRIKRYVHQGGIFLVVGSTTILLTLFAAREVYHFFTPLSALAVAFLSIVFVAVASVVHKTRPLALASLILAGIAPFLVDLPRGDYIFLFTYLLLVVLGTVWVVAASGMKDLTFAALILVVLYTLPHVGSSFFDKDTLLLFVYAFAAIFFITNTVSIAKSENKNFTADLLTAAGNGLFLLMWIMTAAPPDWRSLIIAAWMVVFTIGAFTLYRATGRKEPFYVYAGIGIAMLASATSAELQGETLVIALTLECFAVALVAHAVLRDVSIARRLSLLLIGPVLLSLESIGSPLWRTSILHEDFFVLAIIMAAFLGLGAYFAEVGRAQGEREGSEIDGSLLVAGSIYAYLLIWLSLHAGLPNDDVAVMISLVVYTVIGIIAYFRGSTRGKRGLQIYGGVLLGFVVGRLLFVDVWRMELTGRIITFFLVGALLISTAFLSKRKVAPGLPQP